MTSQMVMTWLMLSMTRDDVPLVDGSDDEDNVPDARAEVDDDDVAGTCGVVT